MKDQNKAIAAVDMLGVLVSRTVFSGMNPIALGFFGATYFIKQGRFFALLLMGLGMSTVLPIEELIKYIMIMIVSGIFVALVEIRVKKAGIYYIAGITGIVTTLIGCSSAYYHHQFQEQLFFCTMEGIIVFATTLLFAKGITWILQCKRNCIPDNEQLISVALMLGSVIFSIGGLQILDYRVATFLAILLTLCFGYKYGAGFGAVIGTVVGLAISLYDKEYSVVGFLCILGIAIGLLRELGRIVSAGGYLIGVISIELYQHQYIYERGQFEVMLAAGVLFLILPNAILRKIDVTGGQQEKGLRYAKENLESITTHKLKEFSKSFYQLSKTFREITLKKLATPKDSVIELIEDLSSQVCSTCEKCDICWKNQYNATYQEFHNFLSTIEEKGCIDKKEVTKGFHKSCVHVNYLLNEGVRLSETAKLNYAWQNRLSESREAIAGQLDEVASIMDEFSNDLYRTSVVSDLVESRIKAILKGHRVHVNQMVILEKRDHRKQVYMIAKAGKGQCVTSREVAQLIGGVLEVSMKPAESTKNVISRSYDTFSFVEDTTFKALTGSARITKLGERISGDNFSILNLENGQMILSLSDGMGTGVNANEESESVIELLEQFMEAGFKEESAIRLINSILVLKSENQSFSTIDLSMLNLYTGVCEFVKIGAATTFIKRENWVETISSTSMPVGVFNQVDFDQKSKKLYDGDYVIMMTDGVLDCVKGDDKERFMQDLILGIDLKNPNEIANYILKEALAQNEDVALDDMTVLVAGIWKK